MFSHPYLSSVGAVVFAAEAEAEASYVAGFPVPLPLASVLQSASPVFATNRHARVVESVAIVVILRITIVTVATLPRRAVGREFV